MTKPKAETVKEFSEYVNMTADELEEWLETEDSQTTGWHNSSSAVGPGEGGEAVGHESGRQIVQILRSNPSRSEDGYKDDDVPHMARVVAYCKRHLAQEEKANDGKDDDELMQTKSARSLKNWGHDPLKKRNGGRSSETTPAKRKAPAGSKPNKDADDDKKSKAKAPAKKSGKEAEDKDGGEKEQDEQDRDEDEENDDEEREDDDDDNDDDDDDDDEQQTSDAADDDDRHAAADEATDPDQEEDWDDDEDDEPEEPKTKKAKRS